MVFIFNMHISHTFLIVKNQGAQLTAITSHQITW